MMLDIHLITYRPAALSAQQARHLIKIPLSSQPSQTQYVAQRAVISINSTGFMHNTLATITHEQTQASATSSASNPRVAHTQHCLCRSPSTKKYFESVGWVTILTPYMTSFPVFTGETCVDVSVLCGVAGRFSHTGVIPHSRTGRNYVTIYQKQHEQYIQFFLKRSNSK